MKKILLSSVALATMAGAALAADLPSRRVAPAPYVAVPVFTWTGFYVGVNAGYGFSDSNNRNFGFNGPLTAVGPTATPVVAFPGTVFGNNGANGQNRDGFVGGGQIGYNYQFGNIVVGVEADIQYTDFGRNKNNGNGAFGVAVPNANIGIVAPGQIANVGFFNGGGSQSDYFGTVRGRLGYAFDRMMVYGTGGVAFRDTGSNNNNTFFGFNNGFQQKQEDVGYAVGGGVEYAFTPNITAKVEGLYVNFSEGNRRNNFGGQVVGVTNFGVPVVQTGTRGRDDDFAVVRAGINYKFNGF